MLLQIPKLVIFALLMTSFAVDANECYREGMTWSNIDIFSTFHLGLRQCMQAQYNYLGL